MTKLKVCISDMIHEIPVEDDEVENFKKIISELNIKTNKLFASTDGINTRLLLFLILLINQNKKLKIFNNFEDNIIKLAKSISRLLANTGHTLESQLITSNIIVEHDTSGLQEEIQEEINNEEIQKIINESQAKIDKLEAEKQEIIDNMNKKINLITEQNNKELQENITFVDDLIKILEKLANNINSL